MLSTTNISDEDDGDECFEEDLELEDSALVTSPTTNSFHEGTVNEAEDGDKDNHDQIDNNYLLTHLYLNGEKKPACLSRSLPSLSG